MRQTLGILIIVAAAVVAASPAGAAGADVVAQARELIAGNNPRGAADALENALIDAPADQRAAIIDLLKDAYKKLIEEAKAAGKDRAAAQIAEDLAILEAHPRPASPSPSPAPTEPNPEPSPAEPKPAEPVVAVPRGPQPAEALELPSLSGPADKPAAPAAEPAAAPSAVEEVAPAAPKTAPPPKGTTEPTAANPVPAAAPAPAPASPAPASAPTVNIPAPDPSAAELARADALFTRKRYDEAGRLYAELAGRDRLPVERRKVWAYCRWAAVVARINAPPQSAEEWDAIEREIDDVQLLVPGNWYGEYLKDRVTSGRKSERRGGGLVIRGNTPEEPESVPAPQAVRRPPVDGQLQRAGGGGAALNLPAPGDAPAPLPAPAAAVEWQVLETTNFRVFHVDAALADKAAEAAEAARIAQGARWGSRAVRGAWTPRCDLYLYPTPADFARMTGQPETSPGFSTMGISGDQVTTRRVNLRADHPQLLAAILPHEVAHVVLADVFTDQQIPRWADEGMAVLAEPLAEQEGRAAELNAPLARNQIFKLDQLMNIDYPGEERWGLYYAQSVSLTRFFVERGTPDQFIAFLKRAQARGAEAALRETYQIEGFADLETRWRTFAQRQAAQVASTGGETQR